MKKNKVWKQKIEQRRAYKSFKDKLRFKQYKKQKNKDLLGINSQRRTSINHNNKIKEHFNDYRHIKAPANFSLIHNTEEVLNFISKVEECYKEKKKIFINLSSVEVLGHGAIVVLLSKLVQFKTSKIDVNGNFPKTKNAETLLRKSGFLDYLYEKIEEKDEYSFDNKICTHATKNVAPELSDKIIQNASISVWGDVRRCTGLQRVYLELMQNTNNHASANNPGEKYWWSTISYKKEDNKVCFSFIDFGVGIFESLTNKQDGNKFFGAIEKVKQKYKYGTNAELLKLLLNGDVHKTATGHYYRGKGLPGVFTANQRNQISNLKIISNDAYADPTNDKYVKLKNNLSGTFIYWELNENNINIKD